MSKRISPAKRFSIFSILVNRRKSIKTTPMQFTIRISAIFTGFNCITPSNMNHFSYSLKFIVITPIKILHLWIITFRKSKYTPDFSAIMQNYRGGTLANSSVDVSCHYYMQFLLFFVPPPKRSSFSQYILALTTWQC